VGAPDQREPDLSVSVGLRVGARQLASAREVEPAGEHGVRRRRRARPADGDRVEHGRLGPREPQEKLSGLGVAAVDELVVRLIVVGHEAPVAGRDAGGVRLVAKRGGIIRKVGGLEVHDREGFARDLREHRGLGDEAREHACAALRRFVEEEAVAIVAGGHRLGEDLALLELELLLDAAQERVLQGGEGLLREARVGGLEEERVLAVLDARHDPLARRGGGVLLLLGLVGVARPLARDGVDAETELRAICAAA